MAGEVTLHCLINRPIFPTTPGPQSVYVLMEIKPATNQVFSRTPVNFSLVLDRSGSMVGEKIENVKQAVGHVLDHLAPDDLISLVLFNERSLVSLPAQHIQDVAQLKARVNALKAEGGTSMSKGMQDGLNELKKHTGPTRISRMLLLTDGQTWDDEADCQHLASEAKLSGVTITALGVGDDWNETLLDAIARNSAGRADYIDSPAKIVQLFKDEVRQLQDVVVQGVKAALRLSKGIEPRRIYRVIPDIIDLSHTALSDRDVVVDLGALDKQHGQTLLIELVFPSRSAGRYRVAQAEVSYTVPGAPVGSETVRADVIITLSDDQTQTRQQVGAVMNIVERVTAYQLQLEAKEAAAAGNIARATQKLREAATRLLDMGEAELSQAATQEAKNLEQQGQMSSTGTKKLQYGTRKLTQRLE
ncbi:MAG: VWA domain-containing protein [Candidatus Latescibacteria bacterium]|nr:VWA domain-containing protein [Candidatus Latescibacterota bacterium]